MTPVADRRYRQEAPRLMEEAEMTERTPESGTPPAAAPALPRGEYGEQKLDPTPPPDHGDFVEARGLGLAAIRSRLASRRKKG